MKVTALTKDFNMIFYFLCFLGSSEKKALLNREDVQQLQKMLKFMRAHYPKLFCQLLNAAPEFHALYEADRSRFAFFWQKWNEIEIVAQYRTDPDGFDAYCQKWANTYMNYVSTERKTAEYPSYRCLIGRDASSAESLIPEIEHTVEKIELAYDYFKSGRFYVGGTGDEEILPPFLDQIAISPLTDFDYDIFRWVEKHRTTLLTYDIFQRLYHAGKILA